jgi:hypothetical protein
MRVYNIQHILGDHIRVSKMVRICSTHGRDEKLVRSSQLENLKGIDLGIGGRTTLNFILKKVDVVGFIWLVVGPF